VAPAEIHQALRARGFATVADVHAVVLETDGTFSVVGDPPSGDPSAFEEIDQPGRSPG